MVCHANGENRTGLVTLQIGDTTRNHVVFPAEAAPDGGEYDYLVCTLTLVTDLMKGNKLGIVEAARNTTRTLSGSPWPPDNKRALDI